MTDTSDIPVLNLTAEEKRVYSYLFDRADSDQLGVVTGERAVDFFERTKLSPQTLGEIWQIADTENRGLLTKPGFCMVLRLIGHHQAGREPTPDLAFKPAPIPKFEGLQIPGVVAASPVVGSPNAGQFPPSVLQPQLSGQGGPIRVPPLDPQKVQQYSGLFERSGVQGNLMDGGTAKSIFERAGLPNEVLGRIWTLSDRDQRGALDQTEFIVAMHLITSMKTRTMVGLPNTLPQGLYDAAARKGVPAPAGRQPAAPPSRQFSAGPGVAQARAMSPLARQPGVSSPPPPGGQQPTAWLITAQEKAKYDQFFATIDTQGQGVVAGDQAVQFFSDARLPEETLAQIWDLADMNSEGRLNRDEFAVAMYLIRQQRAPNPAPLPAFLPPALVPPSMRPQVQQAQTASSAFDPPARAPTLPVSAADDLFGLDEPTSPPLKPQSAQVTGLQAQTTGPSRDPFATSQPASPSSPQRFQPQPQQPITMFKPFMPTSAFGASLTQQHTGGSATSSQGQARQAAPMPSHLQQANAMDDLLGDETHAEEAKKLNEDTTELANMSNQIGNLRNQMQQTQTKKVATQQDLNATNTQKRDLELRLQQFRTQYEQEIRTVKELEQQLTTSRESTKKLGQELAMVEGTHQDLQTQHNSISQQLQADQQENIALKQKITQVNAEVAKLKPEIEKLKLDARQQKGMASINKKHLVTNESERDKLQAEKAELEREAHDSQAQSRNALADPVASDHSFERNATLGIAGGAAVGAGAFEAAQHIDEERALPAASVASPAAASVSSTNPFFRSAGTDGIASPPAASSGPTPSAFDSIFGPSSAFAPSGTVGSRTGTPPATSFIGRTIPPVSSSSGPAPDITDSARSASSAGQDTIAAPPTTDQLQESPAAADPPPPMPADRLPFTPSQLPVTNLAVNGPKDADALSTSVAPPASRSGGSETPVAIPGAFTPLPVDAVPGAFPSEDMSPMPPTKNDDFDSAFAGFGQSDKANEGAQTDENLGSTAKPAQKSNGFNSEFPPIQSLELDDDDDSEEELDQHFEDDFAHTFPSAPNGKSAVDAESSVTAQNGSSEATASKSIPEAASSRQSVGQSLFQGSQPETKTGGGKNAFDDFDDFDDLAEAKEADENGPDGGAVFGHQAVDEFNPAFESPAPSMSTTITSQNTPAAPRNFAQSTGNSAFDDFSPTLGSSSVFGGGASSIQQTPQNAQPQDWDAIFSGLDSSKDVNTSLGSSSDPWGLSADNAGTSTSKAQAGGALTPGTEHDDPYLKRLTAMGYPRPDALTALEKHDYDVNKAIDYLTSK